MNASDVVIFVLMAATFGVLVTGVVFMMIGGKKNERYSNKLMVARVALQAAVVALIGAMFMLSR